MDWLNPGLNHGRLIVRTLLDIKRSPYRLPLRSKLRAWSLGFTEWSYLLYNLDVEDPKDFLSDRSYTLHGGRVLGRRSALLVDKWNADFLLGKAGIPRPETFGQLLDGRFYPELECNHSSLLSLLDEKKRVVIKPTYGAGGWAILFLEKTEAGVFANGKPAEQPQLEAILGFYKNGIVTAFAEQAGYSSKVFPHTTNTLRLLVLWDDLREEPFVAAAAHRFGTSDSSLIDNFHGGHKGGLSAPISADGVLGKAMTLSETGQRLFYSHHPDTGSPIDGLAVPGWDRVVGELLGRIERFPLLTMAIGWDLVETETGWVCIEANPGPGIKVWQAHGGILADPRSRRFYQRLKVVR